MDPKSDILDCFEAYCRSKDSGKNHLREEDEGRNTKKERRVKHSFATPRGRHLMHRNREKEPSFLDEDGTQMGLRATDTVRISSSFDEKEDRPLKRTKGMERVTEHGTPFYTSGITAALPQIYERLEEPSQRRGEERAKKTSPLN